jgi:hypothetical protein
MTAVILLAPFILLGVDVQEKDRPERDPKTFAVPFRVTETKHVLVRVKIDGKGPFNLIVDTGAPALFVTTAVGKKLGLKPDKENWIPIDRLDIEGGAFLTKTRGRVEDLFQLEGMNGLGLCGVEVHGLLGYGVLAHFRIELDVTRDKMTWTKLDFEPPPPPRLGKGSGSAGLDALGTTMKVAGALLGKKANPETVVRGYLGLDFVDGEDGAVEVKSVQAKSPAAEAGIQPGDRIDKFQDTKVPSAHELRRKLSRVAVGETVKFHLFRKDKPLEKSFQTGEGL